jgi:uncharacterized protein YndB with AHSA1/START domain
MSNSKILTTAESGKQEIIIEREFDAPRELVFKTVTDPKIIPQWWGPEEYSTEVDVMDVKSGGKWRYVQRDKNGNSFGFHGVYHEVYFPERVIDTFEFEGLPEKGHVILETTKFTELPEGRTKLTVQQVFQSVMDRDEMLQSGMEGGTKETYDRLDVLLEKLNK